MNSYLKNKLNKRKLTFGTWLTIPDLTVVEILSKSKLDWLAIDLEHSQINNSQLFDMIRIIDLCNKPCLVRLPNFDIDKIKKVLDFGAHGIIVPDVRNANEVQKIINSTRYIPDGNRGMGLSRAQGYGDDLNKYIKWQKNNITIFVQIEHFSAVNNLDEILSFKELDGIIIGPYDLSASLRIPGKFENGKFKNIINKIKKIALRRKKNIGYHLVDPSENKVNKLIKSKFNFIIYGVDFRLIKNSINLFKNAK